MQPPELVGKPEFVCKASATPKPRHGPPVDSTGAIVRSVQVRSCTSGCSPRGLIPKNRRFLGVCQALRVINWDRAVIWRWHARSARVGVSDRRTKALAARKISDTMSVLNLRSVRWCGRLWMHMLWSAVTVPLRYRKVP